MKKGLIVLGIVFLTFIIVEVFVSADISIVEIDKTSPILVQDNIRGDNNEIIGDFVLQDQIKLIVNGEIRTISKTNRSTISVSQVNNVSVQLTDYHQASYVGDTSFAVIRVGKEINLTEEGPEKILIFGNKSYEIKPSFVSISSGARVYINDYSVSIPKYPSTLFFDDLYLTIYSISPSRNIAGEPPINFTLLVMKQFNLTEGEKINFQVSDKKGFTLEDAEVHIVCNKTNKGYRLNGIDADFKIKNSQDKKAEVTMYFKSDGLRCYSGSCHELEDYDLEAGTLVDINGKNYLNTFVLNISGNRFLAFNYSFEPNEEIDIELSYMDIKFPFKYYLDSLSSYQQVKHEKIIIEGYCDAEFNEDYPIELTSEQNKYKTWIWEYSNLNTFDDKLKDILLVTESDLPNCTPNWECNDWHDNTCELDYEPIPLYEGGREEAIKGKMDRICYDGCGHSKIEYQDCPSLENPCDQIGLRQSGKYCSAEYKLITQKANNLACEDNFECKTNICTEGYCKSKIQEPNYIIYWIIGGVIVLLAVVLIVVMIVLRKK